MQSGRGDDTCSVCLSVVSLLRAHGRAGEEGRALSTIPLLDAGIGSKQGYGTCRIGCR